MNEQDIHDAYRGIAGLLEQRRLKEAHLQLQALLDTCADYPLQNRLEPTPDLCRQFLKTDSPAIRDRYYRRLADEKSAATGIKPATGETPSSAKASNAPAATSGNAASSSRQAAEKKSPAPSVASSATGVSQAAGTSPAVEASGCEAVCRC